MLFYLAKIHNLLCFCFAFVVFYIVFDSSTSMCEPTSTVFSNVCEVWLLCKMSKSACRLPVRLYAFGTTAFNDCNVICCVLEIISFV